MRIAVLSLHRFHPILMAYSMHGWLAGVESIAFAAYSCSTVYLNYNNIIMMDPTIIEANN